MASRFTTTALVNKIFSFCEAYSGTTLFPYQAQFGKRIIRSVLEGDGDEITALFSRQSGKSETVATICGGLAIILPVLANLPMFVNDSRLNRFKKGFMIGVFAPSLGQAKIVYGRMKKKMEGKIAKALLNDPEIDLTFDVSNGENVMLSNNSLICCQSASDGANIEGNSYMLMIVDEAQDVGNFKYRKSISPMGAFYNATKILIGTATTRKGFFYDSIIRNKSEHKNTGKRNHFQYDWKVVAKYNPSYLKYIEGEKKRLGEESDEFQMSYCLKWILERGMFISESLFDELANPEANITLSDYEKVYVAGIDLGKKMDSTVVTIIEVDWKNPILVEQAKELEIPDYVAYETQVVNWLEIQGDNWDEQYDAIMSFLRDYNIVKVVMDATGVGDAIYDRLRANVDYEVEPYIFNSPSKDALYKNLNTELRAKRVSYPACPEVKEMREFHKFAQQLLDLEKGFKGQLMQVAHPDVAGAHDDYPDSLALAVWGARGDFMAKPETDTQSIYKNTNSGYTNSRNRITARRR